MDAPKDPQRYRKAFERLYGRPPENDEEHKAFCYALYLRRGVIDERFDYDYVNKKLEKHMGAREHYMSIIKREFEAKSEGLREAKSRLADSGKQGAA